MLEAQNFNCIKSSHPLTKLLKPRLKIQQEPKVEQLRLWEKKKRWKHPKMLLCNYRDNLMTLEVYFSLFGNSCLLLSINPCIRARSNHQAEDFKIGMNYRQTCILFAQIKPTKKSKLTFLDLNPVEITSFQEHHFSISINSKMELKF